jgi:predicted secreted protein
MPSAAFWGYGSTFQLGDGATPEVFTSIAEIRDMKPPKMKRDSSDVTSHGSTGGWREFLPNLRDGGEVAIEANWLPNNVTQDEVTGVYEAFTDNVNHNWKIILPDTILTIAFAGHITAFEPETPLDNHGKLSFTIKVSGPVTLS